MRSAIASSFSMGTSRIRPKCGTHNPCFSARLRRNLSGSISTDRRPRSIPNRRKRPTVRPANDLGDLPITLSILWRSDAVKGRTTGLVLLPGTVRVDWLAASEQRSYLTPGKFSVNCAFADGHDRPIRTRRDHGGPRLPAAGSGLFLRLVPAWSFARTVAARHRSTGVGTCKMAQGRRAGAAASLRILAHG